MALAKYFHDKSVSTAVLMNYTPQLYSFFLRKSTAGMNKEEEWPAATEKV
ncbi:hypothetical protein PO124_16570 [Bacillus licheniformis]|nr:hypothetical protein [Bacillus licheniformis]